MSKVCKFRTFPPNILENKNQQKKNKKNRKIVDINENVFYILQNTKYLLAFQEDLIVYGLE